MSERKALYDELCRLLTDYEGSGSEEIPTAADFTRRCKRNEPEPVHCTATVLYAMLVKIQNNWETVITARDE